MLIKLIDAAKDLSIQVHPDDAYARAHEGQNGKTEMGMSSPPRRTPFSIAAFRAIFPGRACAPHRGQHAAEVLRRVNVKAGDTVFIPAGTIHAICRGIVVAEVQQSSNVTYRVCDYGRLGPDGKPRALHIAQALDVTRRTAGVPTPDFGGHLARCDYFTVDLLAAPQAATCGAESFLSLLIHDGEGEVRCGGEAVRAKKGDSLFLPAGSGEGYGSRARSAPSPRASECAGKSGRSAPRFSRFSLRLLLLLGIGLTDLGQKLHEADGIEVCADVALLVGLVKRDVVVADLVEDAVGDDGVLRADQKSSR